MGLASFLGRAGPFSSVNIICFTRRGKGIGWRDNAHTDWSLAGRGGLKGTFAPSQAGSRQTIDCRRVDQRDKVSNSYIKYIPVTTNNNAAYSISYNNGKMSR